jgi:Fe-S-cluster containining protein
MPVLSKCNECGVCCIETEMLLSKQDINLILNNISTNLRKKDFVILNEDGNYQLKNVNDHCIFLDPDSKLCKIFEIRPQGCRFYPLIYDRDHKKCIIDKECPRFNLFYQNKKELATNCKLLKKFVKNKLNLKV